MSRPRTRQSAAEQATGGLVSAGIGLREWLATVESRAPQPSATTFDTRADRPRLPGSAAVAAGKRLRRRGFRIIAPAASFYVTGTAGPPVAGEPERAFHWGADVGSALVAGTRVRRVR